MPYWGTPMMVANSWKSKEALWEHESRGVAIEVAVTRARGDGICVAHEDTLIDLVVLRTTR